MEEMEDGPNLEMSKLSRMNEFKDGRRTGRDLRNDRKNHWGKWCDENDLGCQKAKFSGEAKQHAMQIYNDLNGPFPRYG